MADIDRYRPDDQRATQLLYRRVFGQDRAEASRLRWDWQYQSNPNVPPSGPLIWIAREGQTIIGQYATIPVRLSVKGQEIDAAWGNGSRAPGRVTLARPSGSASPSPVLACSRSCASRRSARCRAS